MNLKRVLFATITAGMLSVTGCAGNVPENNHGNRNGENLARDINRSFNYGTRTNRYNTDFRDDNVYRVNDRYPNRAFYSDDRYANPVPGLGHSTRSNRIGNPFRRHGRTAGRTANVPVRPTVGARNVNPNAGTGIRDNWNNADVNRGTLTRRFGRTTRHTANVTVMPTPTIIPGARINTNRNNWDSSVVNRNTVRNNRNR